jgi:hypothetical protein
MRRGCGAGRGEFAVLDDEGQTQIAKYQMNGAAGCSKYFTRFLSLRAAVFHLYMTTIR